MAMCKWYFFESIDLTPTLTDASYSGWKSLTGNVNWKLDDGTGAGDPLKLLDGNVIVFHPDNWYSGHAKQQGSSCFMAVKYEGYIGTPYTDDTESAYFMINVSDSIFVTDILIHNYFSHGDVNYNGAPYSDLAMNVYMIPAGGPLAGLDADGVRAVVRAWRDGCSDCCRSIYYCEDQGITTGAALVG
jgi:hypothetical protein